MQNQSQCKITCDTQLKTAVCDKFVLSYFDFRYIKFHVAFYNENNVLVTHPLYTARNYLR